MAATFLLLHQYGKNPHSKEVNRQAFDKKNIESIHTITIGYTR